MKTVKENLEFRSIEYPQFNRLPQGIQIVKQLGDLPRTHKTGAFTKSGWFIGFTGPKTTARKEALRLINKELRDLALFHAKPTQWQFEEVILKFKS